MAVARAQDMYMAGFGRRDFVLVRLFMREQTRQEVAVSKSLSQELTNDREIS